jgi:hypothetical protein
MLLQRKGFNRPKGRGTINDMTAIAWATFGLILSTVGILAGALFTAIGRSDALGARIDKQSTDLGARIDNLGSELRAEMRGLREEMTGRFDAQQADLRELRASVARP